MKDSTIEKFWARVDRIGGPAACWPWMGPIAHGYGQLTIVAGSSVRAHRLAWSIVNGAIPVGMLICHHCDNPPCCNPTHLYAGTQLDNMADRKRRGRELSGDKHWSRIRPAAVLRGKDHGRSKLTEEKVRAARVLVAMGIMVKDIAVAFGVSGPAVSYAVAGKTWRHVCP